MSKINKGLFTSLNNAWATPKDFFDELNKKYNFTLDPCASKDNAKCKKYFDEKKNGLLQDWDNEIIFMNPPYGSEIKDWVKKASETRGGVVVCLLPARTDTRYFHEFIYKKRKCKIDFIKGRLTFGTDQYWAWVWEQEYLNGKKNSLYQKHGKRNSAPFPSMLVTFKR